MPATIYYDADADLKALEGKTIAIIGYGSQGHDDLQTAVAQVLGLGVALAAIADDGDGLALEGLEVGVGVVVDRRGHGKLRGKGIGTG